MMWNLLVNSADSGYRQATPEEVVLYAALGFLIVFVGIAFLIFIVWAVGKLIPSLRGEASKSDTEAKSAVEGASTAKIETSDSAEDGLPDEVIAVITAAIAAYYQQQHKKCEFTVKRIKRL